MTAPKIDHGYNNHITLEMGNQGSTAVELVAGQTPCQLMLVEISKPLKAHEVYSTAPDDVFQKPRPRRGRR
jgi:deoxycytidine triphosphate deaminase